MPADRSPPVMDVPAGRYRFNLGARLLAFSRRAIILWRRIQSERKKHSGDRFAFQDIAKEFDAPQIHREHVPSCDRKALRLPAQVARIEADYGRVSNDADEVRLAFIDKKCAQRSAHESLKRYQPKTG